MKNIIKEVQQNEFEELMKLFLSVFKDDHYYANIYKNETTRLQQMEERFSKTIQFCLQHGSVYGIHEQNELVAFLVAFDYPYIAHTYPEAFLDMFALKSENGKISIPYKKELHERIELLGENVTYLLSLGVREDHRRKGYAGQLLDCLLQDHAVDYIVSDVSNDTTLPMYMKRNFKCTPITSGYTFVKALPNINIQELDLSETKVALPISYGNLEEIFDYEKTPTKKINIHGYQVDTQYNIAFFKKEPSANCEANVYDVNYNELLTIQKYINVAQYHEEYLHDSDNEPFILYRAIQYYKGPVLYNDTLKEMVINKQSEWKFHYDMQVIIPMEYEDASYFQSKQTSFDEDMLTFHRHLNFRTHYEAGVFNGDEIIDDRSGFKRRIERYCLKKLRVKIENEVSVDTYDSHGDMIGQPAYVNLMISLDKSGKAALVSIISMSSPFLISHFMDNVMRNQLFVETKEGKWINLYQYLLKEYHLYKRGTPKFFVNFLQDKQSVSKEQLASLLLGETIYNKNEGLGCVCDEEIVKLIDKENGMGQYDRAYVYAHTNVCIQFSNHLQTSIKGRLSEEAITFFYIELLGFEEAVIQIANQHISKFLTEEHNQTVSDYLENTYKIYSDYAHTIEFWDIQMNYPSSRKSLSMLRDAFKIEEQRIYMDRNLLQLQRIFETQRDIVDRKENSLLNYLILFLTLLQGIAILFPMWFSEADYASPYRYIGIGIIGFILALCLLRKIRAQRIHK